jgi:enhancing lycopene biosynthesis protein 2
VTLQEPGLAGASAVAAQAQLLQQLLIVPAGIGGSKGKAGSHKTSRCKVESNAKTVAGCKLHLVDSCIGSTCAAVFVMYWS